jgi:type I restriction enzyme S subunit
VTELWAEAAVGDIAELADGPFGSNLKTAHYTETGPRVVRLQNIGDGVFHDERAHIARGHYGRLAKHAVRPGDVVAASLGEDAPRACLIPSWLGPAVVKADCIRVRTFDGVEPAFLMWMLNSPRLRAQAASAIKGVGRPRLGLGGLKRLRVPVPPRNEQRRIVAAIEEHLSHLDAAERSLHGARQKLEALRGNTLLHAVDGNWPLRPLGEVLVSLRNGVFVSRPAAEPPGIPIFRISAVRPLTLEVDDVRFADIDPAKADGYFVQEGDLLFTRYSGNPEYVGACARVVALPRPTLHPDKLIRAVVDRSVAEPGFIAIALSTGPSRSAIEQRRKTTAGQVGIAGSELKKVPVPIPPLDEQRRILAEAERQLSIVAAMAAEISRALRNGAGLRRSILEQAFTGKLVPQDPSDEPASVLLERIAAARSASPAPRRRAAKARA